MARAISVDAEQIADNILRRFQNVEWRRGGGGTIEGGRRHSGAALIEKNHVTDVAQPIEEPKERRNASHAASGDAGAAGEKADRAAGWHGSAAQAHERDFDRPARLRVAVLDHGQAAELRVVILAV